MTHRRGRPRSNRAPRCIRLGGRCPDPGSVRWPHLLLNAAQALGDSGAITVETFAESNAVVVRVCDDGCGIPAADREKVFDPFLENENFRRAIKDYAEEDFKTYDQKIREDVTYLMNNLMERYRYTEQGAKAVCIYVIDNDLARKFT